MQVRRANNYPSIKEYIKRVREEERSDSGESDEQQIFQKSKKTSKSPIKEYQQIKNTLKSEEMDEVKEMLMNITGVVNRDCQENNRDVKEI